MATAVMEPQGERIRGILMLHAIKSGLPMAPEGRSVPWAVFPASRRPAARERVLTGTHGYSRNGIDSAAVLFCSQGHTEGELDMSGSFLAVVLMGTHGYAPRASWTCRGPSSL